MIVFNSLELIKNHLMARARLDIVIPAMKLQSLRNSVLLVALALAGQHSSAAVLQANRGKDWYQAGVPGGIPNVTTIYTSFSPGASASQINTALANCPSNQVVFLNAGTYDMGGSRISIRKDGVVLRGATNAQGFATTILNNTDIQMSRGQWPSANWGSLSSKGIVSGLTEGSTAITLDSTPGVDFKVGDVFMIDQLDDGVNVTTSSVTWAHRPNRSYCFVALCTGISGNTVSFQPPLLGEYWSTARTPQAFGWSSTFGPTLKNAGLENVDVNPNGNNYNMMMGPAWACWARNVRTTGWPSSGGSAGFRMTYSAQCSLEWSIFHDLGVVTSSSYAVYPVVVTGCAVEGNIFTNLALAMPCISAVGCSFSYNYGTGPYAYSPSSWFAEYLFPHGGHTHDTLYEGNCVEGPIYMDSVFGGNNSRIAIVRNRISGYAPGKSGNCTPITLEGNMDNFSILGNVLGDTRYHTSYGQMVGIATGCIGTLKLGNYNTVNGGVNVAEVLPIGDTIAASYRYASKPSWFGNLPWPSFALASSSTTLLAATNHPAGYRSIMGKNPPGGPVNNPPLVSASVSTNSGRAPLTVNFFSTGSSDPEGAALTYSWNFGDGTAASTAANPSHTYSTSGTFTARLTVSDGVNTSVSSDIPITVTAAGSNYPPTVTISSSVTAGAVPLAVIFSSTASDPEGSPLSYAWNFGDGTSSTAANPSHTFQAAGSYPVILTVSDGTNSVASSPLTIAVAAAGSGLQAAYSFEEGAGATVGDVSGKGNVGTATGVSWTTSGRYGKAIGLGSGALVTVSNSPSLSLSTAMTLEVWVYPTNLTAEWRNLIMKPNGSPSDANPSYVLSGTSPATVPTAFISPASANLQAPAPLPLNTWSHIAVTYDGTKMSYYLNGVLSASSSISGAITASSDALTIGGNVYSGQNWKGFIDEVRIYNRALSAAEIVADMNTPLVGTNPPPSAPAAPQGLRVISP